MRMRDFLKQRRINIDPYPVDEYDVIKDNGLNSLSFKGKINKLVL